MFYTCIEIIFLKISKRLGCGAFRYAVYQVFATLVIIINLARHTNKSMTWDSHGNFLIFSGQ